MGTDKEYGAGYSINYTKKNILKEVMEITGGKGVHTTFDAVGKGIFKTDIAVFWRKGTIVSYGNASGVIPLLVLGTLTPQERNAFKSIFVWMLNWSSEMDTL